MKHIVDRVYHLLSEFLELSLILLLMHSSSVTICDSLNCLFVKSRSDLVTKEYLGVLRFRGSLRVVLVVA